MMFWWVDKDSNLGSTLEVPKTPCLWRAYDDENMNEQGKRQHGDVPKYNALIGGLLIPCTLRRGLGVPT